MINIGSPEKLNNGDLKIIDEANQIHSGTHRKLVI